MKIGQYLTYNKKKNFIKKIFGLLVMTLILTTLLKALPKIVTWVKAAVVTSGVVLNNEIPEQTGTKGTQSNPFVILEIVPYEGYAEIGYLIDGCEPVNIEKLRTVKDPFVNIKTVTATKASKADWGMQYRFVDEVDIPSDWVAETVEKTLYGYYEKVADNTGSFQQVVDETTGKIQYIKVDSNKGNIIWKTIFEMTEDDVMPTQSLLAIGDRGYTKRMDTECKKGFAYTYTNYNYFIEKVFGITDKNKIKDYHVVVKTVEPDELNTHLEWIDRADLIYISPKSHITNLPKVWELYNKAGKSANSSPALNFGAKDLNWEATLRIFNKVIVAEDYAAIIFDWTVYTNPPDTKKDVVSYQLDYNERKITTNPNFIQSGNSNNVYKLALMMRTMDPKIFYNLFLNDYKGTVTPLVQNGLFTVQPTEDAKNYWTQNTFMPTQKDGSGASDIYWSALWDTYKLNPNMGDNVSVAGRIYTYNGDCSLSQNLVDNMIDKDENKYTKEFRDYVAATGGKKDPATAIQYILSHPGEEENQKESLKILDIEPSNEFTLTEDNIRMMMPKYSGKIQIEQMTSAEFIGIIDDLNSTYDMIYLGMNCGGFNTTSQDIDGKTLLLPDYNEDILDGKIYLHVGDKITGNGHDVNWLPSGYDDLTKKNSTRMPGNDITKKKSEALLNYIKAGYPILVDSKLYNTKTPLTIALVDKNSYIYNFIDTTKNNVIYENLINAAASDSFNKVKKYIKLQKPILKINDLPVPYIGNSTGGVITKENYINGVNINDRELRFNYTIVEADMDKRYTVNLYIDANADGRFADSELNMSQKEVAPNSSKNFIKPLAGNYFGVIPWKLEIIDNCNSNIRDNQTGYSAVMRKDAQKETIRILQINQNSSSTLNLMDNAEFKTYTENLIDFKIKFETITIKEFEDRYKKKQFINNSEKTKLETDQLISNYEMLIFGFADNYGDISNEDGALDNVMYYIKNYKSVLFTHDVTSFNNDSSNPGQPGYYFNVNYRDILGMDRFGVRTPTLTPTLGFDRDLPTSPDGPNYHQIHGYSYYALKRIANSGQLLTFKGLVASEDNSITTTVTKLNDGQLTQYPYLIDKTFSIAKTHGQYYQLNMEDPEIVVWYCLASGSGGDSLYDLSPNDASNNYYIYNKGNITYSGVGHDTVKGSVMEVKLFINTMIAAYKASLKNPTIQILNPHAYDPSSKISYIESSSDKTTVRFIPWDYNFLSQNLGVKVVVPGKILKIYDENGKDEMMTSFVSSTGEESMIRLLNGTAYTIVYDDKDFDKEALRQILFTVQNEKGLKENCKVEFYERALFDLD